MKKTKIQKGITLVALIITVIVLLILAGVTIGSISGDGIIGHAKNTKQDLEKLEEEELLKSAIISAPSNISVEYLQKRIGTDKAKVYGFGDEYIIQFLDSERTYCIDSDLEVKIASSDLLIQDNTPGSLDGSGTEEDPFVIMSIEDLMYLSQSTSSGTTYKNKYIKLGKTLNFESEISYCNYQTKEYNEFLGITDNVGLLEALTNKKYAGFKPIDGFGGTFDGNNKAINKLYENTTGDAALFKSPAWGTAPTIKNLEITGNIICSGDNTGAILAKCNLSISIENCISRVNIKSTANNVGGIVGTYGVINNCKNYGTVEGTDHVGGISGYTGVINNCQNYGTIKGTSNVGGINGGSASTINECENHGEIIATGDYAGGITGNGNKNNVYNNNVNYAKVTANNYAGGIAGGAWGYILNCYNIGEITATESYAGGIGGYMTTASPIINCYNEGKVKGKSIVGGILGGMAYTQNDTTRIINCYTTGEIGGNSMVGGIAGRKSGYGTNYIENCYWPQEYGLNCCNLAATTLLLEITNSEAYTKEYMKTQDFLDKLNSYVNTYNQGDKAYSNGVDLISWTFSKETGYPILNFE